MKCKTICVLLKIKKKSIITAAQITKIYSNHISICSIPDSPCDHCCHGRSLETWATIRNQRRYTETGHCGPKEHC